MSFDPEYWLRGAAPSLLSCVSITEANRQLTLRLQLLGQRHNFEVTGDVEILADKSAGRFQITPKGQDPKNVYVKF